jgi:hypothetical protein
MQVDEYHPKEQLEQEIRTLQNQIDSLERDKVKCRIKLSMVADYLPDETFDLNQVADLLRKYGKSFAASRVFSSADTLRTWLDEQDLFEGDIGAQNYVQIGWFKNKRFWDDQLNRYKTECYVTLSGILGIAEATFDTGLILPALL